VPIPESARADKRLQDQMTQAKLADARDKARNSRDGATRAIRTAWSHVLFPAESNEPGKPFDLDHLSITARERSGVTAAVYDKKAFEAILSAVVTELQRTRGAKVRVTLEIEADATEGFSEANIGVVRDNARRLKFRAESTGFE
jgi:hypothetical protein